MTTIEFRKDLFADERDDNLNEIGKPKLRQDIVGHVTGRSPYYDDHLFEGLLHMRCVRSPHHHARIRAIDYTRAEAMPGVVRIVRPQDVPHNINTLLSLINFGRDDEALLQPDKVAYKGEPVAAVIATSERAARDAVAAITVDYEVLAHVLDLDAALAPDAPIVNETYPNNTFDYHERFDHQKLRFGDVDAAFAQADHIVEDSYQMSPIEQAPLETCGAIAAPETNDRYVCYTGTQALFFSLGTTAKLLDMASSRLHFIGGTVGGGFGGKVDSLHEPLAVLGAMLTGAPVKFCFDREEEMQVGAPRGAERWHIKDGVMNDGRIVARAFTGLFDAGAYTRLSSYAIVKATGHLPGPYTIPNIASNVYCVYTNRTPATAMRGFGITGVDFAIECHMDQVAERVGADPIELRLINAYRDGDMKAHRRSAKNTALIECCQVAAQKAQWALSPQMAALSSLQGGGEGWRAQIPATPTDAVGQIGERRRQTVPLEPGQHGAPAGQVPAGQAGETVHAAPPQREDMQVAPERIGHRTAATPGYPASPGPQRSTPVVPPAHAPAYASASPSPRGTPAAPATRTFASPTPQPPPPLQASPAPALQDLSLQRQPPPSSPSSSSPSSSPLRTTGYQPLPPYQPQPAHHRPAAGGPGTSASNAPAASTASTTPPSPAPSPPPSTASPPTAPSGDGPASDAYRPEQPFQRGVKRPGVSRFISGTRRR